MGMQRQKRLSNFLTYLLLTLGLAIVAVPFWYMFVTSMKPQSYIFEMPPRLWPEEFTLTNYVEAITRDKFDLYFLNSLFVAVISTISTVMISSMMAYAFARMKFPGKKVLFYVILLGMMIPPVTLLVPQFIVAKNLMLVNKFSGLILVYITMNISQQTFLLRGFFEGIPREIEEAAIIDGAGRWKIFSRIILPLSKPGLAAVSIFTFLYCWDEFAWAQVMMTDTAKRTLPIGIALFQSQHLTRWGLVFAASIISFIPVVLVFTMFQKHFIKGISTTGLKG
jgi:multiple sugar transport system permease protein